MRVLTRLSNAIKIGRFLQREDNRKTILRSIRNKTGLSAAADSSSIDLAFPFVSRRRLLLVLANANLVQCRRYRAMQKVDAFRTAGFDVRIEPYSQCGHDRDFSGFDWVLMQRPEANEGNARLANRISSQTKLVVDIDDAVFSTAALSSHTGLKDLPEAMVSSIFGAAEYYQLIMSKAHAFCASTPELKRLADADGLVRHSFVWPNLLDRQHFTVAKYFASPFCPVRLPGNILYTTLSRGTDPDFAVLGPCIASVLRKSDARLVVAGVLPENATEYVPADRITHAPPLNYLTHLYRLGRYSVGCVPMAATMFNNCKSAIRLQEGYLLGATMFVSATSENRRVCDSIDDPCGIIVLDDVGNEEASERMVAQLQAPDSARERHHRIESLRQSSLDLEWISKQLCEEMLSCAM